MATTSTNWTAERLGREHPHQRCELVRGELRVISPSGGEHGWVVVNVTAPLSSFVKQKQLGYVFGAETGFILARNPDTVRAPDVAFVRRDRVEGKLPKEFFPGAPDLAVEVLSPGDSASEVDEKAEDWLRSGCSEVWLIDPRRRTVASCTLQGNATLRRPMEVLGSELLPGFELPVEELFQ